MFVFKKKNKKENNISRPKKEEENERRTEHEEKKSYVPLLRLRFQLKAKKATNEKSKRVRYNENTSVAEILKVARAMLKREKHLSENQLNSCELYLTFEEVELKNNELVKNILASSEKTGSDQIFWVRRHEKETPTTTIDIKETTTIDIKEMNKVDVEKWFCSWKDKNMDFWSDKLIPRNTPEDHGEGGKYINRLTQDDIKEHAAIHPFSESFWKDLTDLKNDGYTK